MNDKQRMRGIWTRLLFMILEVGVGSLGADGAGASLMISCTSGRPIAMSIFLDATQQLEQIRQPANAFMSATEVVALRRLTWVAGGAMWRELCVARLLVVFVWSV